MYIDLEGVDLCREGSLSIFTLLIGTGISIRQVYFIDVQKLGAVLETATLAYSHEREVDFVSRPMNTRYQVVWRRKYDL